MTRLIILFMGFALLSCSTEYYDLDGNWTLLYIEYEGEDVSGIDKSGAAWMAKTMVIESNSSAIKIPYVQGILNCEIEQKSEAKIVFRSCSDEKFNGEYSLKRTIVRQYDEDNGTFGMEISNAHLLIYGESSFVKF